MLLCVASRGPLTVTTVKTDSDTVGTLKKRQSAKIYTKCHNVLASMVDRPVNALQLSSLTEFIQRKFVDFPQAVRFCTENGRFAFLRPPPRGLRSNV